MIEATRFSVIRGPLSLTISTATPQIVAGNDFSIFVIVQNPYDVPVTLHQVQTHIPVELFDVNQEMLERARAEQARPASRWYRQPWDSVQRFARRNRHRNHGYATAVSTDFAPATARELFRPNIAVEKIDGGAVITGVQFNFPMNPTADELDRILQRVQERQSGTSPVVLQPGDSLVRQFRLRTRRWLLFTPLSHTFQIQAYYSADGTDHSCAIAFQATIRGRMAAVSIGAIAGAALGSVLKGLTAPAPVPGMDVAKAGLIAALASIAVVVAFARRANAQSLVSVEDFWGGVLIGVSVGFIGHAQFTHLFT